MDTDKHRFKKMLLRHETILLIVVALEWLYFNSVGLRFGSRVSPSVDCIVTRLLELGSSCWWFS